MHSSRLYDSELSSDCSLAKILKRKAKRASPPHPQELGTFYSENESWSNTTKLLLDIRRFLREISLIQQLYSHSIQMNTFGDQLLPYSDFQECLDLVSASDESNLSHMAYGLKKFHD